MSDRASRFTVRYTPAPDAERQIHYHRTMIRLESQYAVDNGRIEHNIYSGQQRCSAAAVIENRLSGRRQRWFSDERCHDSDYRLSTEWKSREFCLCCGDVSVHLNGIYLLVYAFVLFIHLHCKLNKNIQQHNRLKKIRYGGDECLFSCVAFSCEEPTIPLKRICNTPQFRIVGV